MPEVLLTTAYFAPVSYYAYLWHSERACIEQCEHYHKQSWRNRCLLAAANGPMALTVPVEHENNQDIRSVRITENGHWRHRHWQSIASAYQSSPFFEYYEDDLRPLVEEPSLPLLFDFNELIRQRICELLDIHTPTALAEAFKPDYQSTDTLADLREEIHPKRDFRSLPGYRPKKYTQVFEGKFGFLPELSILDLLFNMGPESVLILRDSLPAPVTDKSER
ncbi:MAG: WbqC family protein [Bacteroidales bacterium]|nr:WbqC family protein [Bacteroidales bacterium]